MRNDRNDTLTSRKPRRVILVTGTKLKVYACITMLFYTIGVSIVQNGLIHVNQYTSEELSQALSENADLMVLSGWASVFQLIGGLAVPVFAFLLVEGFVHTSSVRNYLLRLLAFAVISEIPYDLAMNGVLWDTGSQNSLFTLAVCLVMLYSLRLLEQRPGIAWKLFQLLVVLAAALWCSLLHLNCGLCMVLICAIFYKLYDRKGVRLLLGCAVSVMYVTGPFSGYLLWNYCGDRGWDKNKYIFYAFYPLHLLVLGVIARMMGA
ncbi:MAG: conjugal transfer protein TraX [Clostridiales bacterium]|nr:conjugal transfer protein TraX [Clostridiales bacterium]